MKYLKKMNYVFLLTMLCFVVACSPKQEASTIETNEVEIIIDDWLILWSTYDLDMVSEIFWQNEQATYFSSEKEGLIKGYDQFIAHHEGFGFVKGGNSAEKSLWLEAINTTVHKGTAVVEAVWYFGDETAAKATVQNGPVSFVLVRNKTGEVRIAHTHFANYESWKTAGN